MKNNQILANDKGTKGSWENGGKSSGNKRKSENNGRKNWLIEWKKADDRFFNEPIRKCISYSYPTTHTHVYARAQTIFISLCTYKYLIYLHTYVFIFALTLSILGFKYALRLSYSSAKEIKRKIVLE